MSLYDYAEPYRQSTSISTFYGLNRAGRILNGELSETKNLTSSEFPLLATRNRRAILASGCSSLEGLYSAEKIAYVKNGSLYYGGIQVPLSVPLLSLSNGRTRKIVSMGAYLLIFPDKLYVNTADLTDNGSMEATFSTSSGTTVTYSACREDGSLYENVTSSQSSPAEPADGALWLDTSRVPNVLMQYSEYSGTWNGIASTYVKISCPGIGSAFSQYDGVEISGSTVESLNTSTVLWSVSENWITVAGIVSGTVTQTQPLTVSRKVPDMDYYAEGDNRLWGCSNANNEIYACKLGDFKNWNCFMGLSTDSYAVSAGTHGDFTGAVRYLSSVLFFKEDCVHRIYGVNPPYTVSVSYCSGVQKGSWRSLAVVDGSLYYMSPTGVCKFEGSMPVRVDSDLGSGYRTNAVGGAFRGKYYVCLTELNGERTLYAFDTQRGLWHGEDNTDVRELAVNNSNLYFIAYNSANSTYYAGITDGENPCGAFTGLHSGFELEALQPWCAVTGRLGENAGFPKYVRAVTVRASVDANSTMSVYAQYDDSGLWELLDTVSPRTMLAFTLPLGIMRKCDYMRLKLCGTGGVRVSSVTFETEE